MSFIVKGKAKIQNIGFKMLGHISNMNYDWGIDKEKELGLEFIMCTHNHSWSFKQFSVCFHSYMWENKINQPLPKRSCVLLEENMK